MRQDWYRTALQHPAPQVREHRPDSPADNAPQRFDMSLPANQRKLEVVEELGRLAEGAGLSLIELAIAFVIRHPGVTSAAAAASR